MYKRNNNNVDQIKRVLMLDNFQYKKASVVIYLSQTMKYAIGFDDKLACICKLLLC